ncbi:LuxR C-terminal-related transcriptional regulator [Kitasatospora sp. NPDC054939]
MDIQGENGTQEAVRSAGGGWADPAAVLARAVEVLGAPRARSMVTISRVLADLVPHTAVAQLSRVCTYSPVSAVGAPEVAGRITSRELADLADLVEPGRPWQGEAVLAGRERPVLAVASRPANSNGSLLVLVRGSDAPLGEDVPAVLQQLWEVVTTHNHHRATDAAPVQTAASRASAGVRAKAIAELSGEHASALSTILATLRSARLDDAAARRGATELAVGALLELRAYADLDRELSEEPADASFARLGEELRPLLRHSPVRLELVPPATAPGGRTLPADIALTARAAVRSTVLTLLEQGEPGRLHVSWQLTGDALRAVVRDDGPGLLTVEALAVHGTAERVQVLGGRLAVDAVPGWGTTVTVELPLTAPAVAAADGPLDGLHPRELEVLDQLAQGRRNRDIAQALHISESTVKFHVANILAKLGVGSRGEAAALAHRAGLPSTTTLHAVS